MASALLTFEKRHFALAEGFDLHMPTKARALPESCGGSSAPPPIYAACPAAGGHDSRFELPQFFLGGRVPTQVIELPTRRSQDDSGCSAYELAGMAAGL